MVEFAAQHKYTCPACGGEALWRPEQQKLICASCGAESPMSNPPDARELVPKYSLDAGLTERVITDVGPAAAERIAVRCQSCQAISEFEHGHVADHCQFCGAAEIVPYDSLADRFRPESVLPFRIDRNLARDRLQAWYRSVWLAPNALRRQARLDTYAGVYLPYWLFDANAVAVWHGKGSAGGVEEKSYVDFPVPASRGIDWNLLRELAPFPTRDLKAYNTQYVAGFTVERYQVPLKDGAAQAHEWMKADLLDRCKKHEPMDRDQVRMDTPEFRQEFFKLALLPIWLLTYRYAGKPYHVTVNGATGEVAGKHPYSPIKVTLVLFLLVEIYFFFQDPEFAIKLPFWLIEGVWWLISKPFTS
jgi:predicted RNA-binding Zn-ribbon protein involved in translation (DUF1610 family)